MSSLQDYQRNDIWIFEGMLHLSSNIGEFNNEMKETEENILNKNFMKAILRKQ